MRTSVDHAVLAPAMRVGVFGIWHLGAVTAACLAHLGFRVTGVEANAARLASLKSGVPPLYEPGLAELMDREIAAGRLHFVADPAAAAGDADVVILAEDVPVNDADEPDVSGLLETARAIAPHLRAGTTLIVMSQVPVGTCALLQRTVSEAHPGVEIHVAYCPENLRLGAAIERFLHPDMVIIGADTPAARSRVETLYSGTQAPKVIMDIRSAEMTKHALNVLLATAISFGNEVGMLCERLGIDAVRVTEAIRLDRRIGFGLPLLPGPPFSGGTLARDLQVLRRLASARSVAMPLLEGVLAVNERQKMLALDRLQEALGDLAGARVAVLGLTYKPGTSTVRRSLAVELIRTLAVRGASVAAYDPKADLSEATALPPFVRAPDPVAAARGADAVVIMTDWPEFRALDLHALRAAMRGNVLIDTRNMLDADTAAATAFSYYGIGRRS